LKYLDSRLLLLNYDSGAVLAVESWFLGYDGTAASLDVDYQGLKYSVVPDGQHTNQLWMRDNNIVNQIGTLSGVISLKNSSMLIQSDGSYDSPERDFK
jgi:hypothetical protein